MGLHKGYKKVSIGDRIRDNILFGMVIILIGGCVYYFVAIVKAATEMVFSLF